MKSIKQNNSYQSHYKFSQLTQQLNNFCSYKNIQKQKYIHFIGTVKKMQAFDQQLNLISREIQLIQKSSHQKQPYLVNGFNDKFDEILKELVVEYGFDFDKIALHLYYQFPQYEQRINCKTVTFRWWQIQEGILQEKKIQEKLIKKELKQQANMEEQNDKVELLTQNIFPFFEKPIENASFSTISTQSYSKAMQKSQILTQEESQRFILYKPKFIVDTQYQLERYEVGEGWMSAEEKGENLSQLVIEKLLKKVVSNEFEYDEFGGFGMEEKKVGQKEKKGKNKWWQQDERESEQEEQDSEMIEQNEQAHAGAGFQQEKGLYRQQESDKKPIKHQIKVYELDEDWDQYESD